MNHTVNATEFRAVLIYAVLSLTLRPLKLKGTVDYLT
jgi:hypothetical protein